MDDRVTREQQVVNKADQISEEHGAKTSDDAQAKRQQRELRERQLAAFFSVHHVCRRIGSEPRSPTDAVGGVGVRLVQLI